MREILFRGKARASGEWHFGMFCDEGYDADFPSIIPNEEDHSVDISDWEVRPETVGQYTGFDDKDRVKIFEGDIVKVIHDGQKKIRGKRFAVELRKGCWMIEREDEWGFLVKNAENVRVIGNIHDNPELLLEELK